MKYFVTGGAGFIGREVVKQLLLLNHKICVYDDFSFGRKENLEQFKHDTQLETIKGKIENHSELLESMKVFQPDIVIHLAAIHFIPFCNSHPLETIRINVEGTHSVFEAAVLCNVKRVLVASSGAIYASEEHELREDKDIPIPLDIYGISKLLCEHCCKYYSDRYGIISVAMRFFNTYGPYETNPHLIPEIIAQIKDTGSLSLGNLKTKRDYIFVEDIARAVVELTICEFDKQFLTVNIGTGTEYSGEEIINEIRKILARDIPVEIDPNKFRPSDKLHQIASLETIRSLTGYRPKFSLNKGMTQLLQYEGLVK